MYDNQIKTATKGKNLSFAGACVCFTLLGVAIGALHSKSIFQFINYLIN